MISGRLVPHARPTPHQELRPARRPGDPGAAARADRVLASVRDRFFGSAARPRRHLRPPGPSLPGDRLRHRRAHRRPGPGASRERLPRNRGAPLRGGQAPPDGTRGESRQFAHRQPRCRRGPRAGRAGPLVRRDSRLLPRPLAQEAPPQAPADRRGLRRDARREASAGGRAAARHRLAGVCRADAHPMQCLRRAGLAEPRKRLRAAAGVSAADAIRAPRRAPRPRRLGPRLRQRSFPESHR